MQASNIPSSTDHDMTADRSAWKDYFHDIGINELFVDSYMYFVDAAIENEIPPIFEIEHLSRLLGRNVGDLSSMINSPERYYRSFRIRKRSGGYRNLSSPLPSLLECQRWILKNILMKFETSICATAYTKGKSILYNAKLHCNRSCLVKLDITDFFGSISLDRVIHLFRKMGYPKNVSFYLASLCCRNGKLPQGAATSPALANLICKRMDDQFYKFCRSNNLRYSRYSDDIAVSGKSITPSQIRYCFETLEAFGFEVNTKKFRILGETETKKITGLDISSGKPRVPRSFRRNLSKDIYFVWSAGLDSHVAREKIFFPNYLESLRGRVEYWRWIEPTCPQLEKCSERLRQVEQARSII